MIIPNKVFDMVVMYSTAKADGMKLTEHEVMMHIALCEMIASYAKCKKIQVDQISERLLRGQPNEMMLEEQFKQSMGEIHGTTKENDDEGDEPVINARPDSQ